MGRNGPRKSYGSHCLGELSELSDSGLADLKTSTPGHAEGAAVEGAPDIPNVQVCRCGVCRRRDKKIGSCQRLDKLVRLTTGNHKAWPNAASVTVRRLVTCEDMSGSKRCRLTKETFNRKNAWLRAAHAVLSPTQNQCRAPAR
jgi:hypothetical protein